MSAPKKYYQSFEYPKSIADRNIQKIILFYLFNCPVAGTSVRGKTFSYYGFEGTRSFSMLKKAMLKCASESLKTNYIASKKSELPEHFSKIESLGPPNEYCVFLYNEEKNRMASLFSAIRNAIAHGSFNCKTYNSKKIFFFLNYDGYKKAQIVLHETTLLSWINIIEAGYGNIQHFL